MAVALTLSFAKATAQAYYSLRALRNLNVFSSDNGDLRGHVLNAKTNMFSADSLLRNITGQDMSGLREDARTSQYPMPQNRAQAAQMFDAARVAVVNTIDALHACPPAQAEARKALALGVQGLMVNAVYLANELAEFLDTKQINVSMGHPMLGTRM